MEIAVSRWAARFIKRQGGRIYIWYEDAGSALAALHADTNPPAGPWHFERFDADGIEVFVAEDVEVPVLALGLRVWPHPHVVAVAFWHKPGLLDFIHW